MISFNLNIYVAHLFGYITRLMFYSFISSLILDKIYVHGCLLWQKYGVNILICQAESGVLTEPLWDAATVTYPYPNNVAFVREYTIKLLSSSFPNMTAAEV